MKVKGIKIENYRSIKSIDFKVEEVGEQKCFILLGINEVGKSNILKGIGLIDSTDPVDYKADCNKHSIDLNSNILITYELELESESFKKPLEESKVNKELVDLVKFEKIERIVDVSSTERSDYYHVWVKESEKFSKFISFLISQ